jgi:hypothetical protein
MFSNKFLLKLLGYFFDRGGNHAAEQLVKAVESAYSDALIKQAHRFEGNYLYSSSELIETHLMFQKDGFARVSLKKKLLH